MVMFGQNDNATLETLNKVAKIIAEVSKINLTEKEYDEGIAEGTIEFKSIFRRKGAWDAHFLYKNQNDNPPIRIKYSETAKKGYDDFEFYYVNERLIYAKFIKTITRGKDKGVIIDRKFYYENGNLIFTTASEKEKYSDYIKRTEKTVRFLIYQ